MGILYSFLCCYKIIVFHSELFFFLLFYSFIHIIYLYDVTHTYLVQCGCSFSCYYYVLLLLLLLLLMLLLWWINNNLKWLLIKTKKQQQRKSTKPKKIKFYNSLKYRARVLNMCSSVSVCVSVCFAVSQRGSRSHERNNNKHRENTT